MVLSGNKQSVQILIFSKQYDAIADHNKGSRTWCDCPQFKGWYKRKQGCRGCARKNESSSILRIIKEVDKTAFLSVGSVMGVYGKGFDKIKSGLKKKK